MADTNTQNTTNAMPPGDVAKKARFEKAKEDFANRDVSKGRGDLLSLYHAEEHHGLILEKKLAKMEMNGATAEEIAKVKQAGTKGLSMLDKIRPGKTAALAGAVALTGVVLASMGNKGPGEQAASIEASKDEAPEQSAARA